MRPPLCTIYQVISTRFKIPSEDGLVGGQLIARWIGEGQDSPLTRQQVVREIGEKIGVPGLRVQDVSFEVSAVAPRYAAGESEIRYGPYRKVPTGRAQAVLQLAITQGDLDRCFDFEERLDHELQKLGVGHVDGNDIGQGLYRIFCFGPRKEPLMQAVEAIASQAREDLPPWKIVRGL